MQLPRFFLEKINIRKQRFFINDESICHQLRQVWRKDKGAKIMLFDGDGKEYEAEIRYLTKEQASGIILAEHEMLEEWPYVIVAQAMPKAGKADDIVQMCTEAGAREFVFFESEYSIPKVNSYDQLKIERLTRVATEAGRQSERAFLPIIDPTITFEKLLASKVEKKYLLHSRQTLNSVSLLELAKGLTKQDIVMVIIGPEGGFSPREVEMAQKAGVEIAYLNLPILRTENAGIVAVSLLVSALNR